MTSMFRFTRRDSDQSEDQIEAWSNDYPTIEIAIEVAITLFEDEEDFDLIMQESGEIESTIRIYRNPDPSQMGKRDARAGAKTTYPDAVQQGMYDLAYRDELAIMESGARRLR